jgi:superfamily II DNA/RNA helicase
MSNEVQGASRKYQKTPIFYKDPKSDIQTNENIAQHYIKVNKDNKVALIAKLIRDSNFYLTIIFVNTKKSAK